ncbi:DUF45 domain-containing protein [Variovorax dokdonensis]|uniref:DUF45 domain-containing protein n=1 Tax=Variovorax dokdonensis TaxID=344883 RepID=A0ABT7N4L7_9BURK|nr:YgjP-like metallopeptidase domain-containing protein [Variovorax dokdonensis]MDM0042869.1 DUF45 domain-containing protein [Variovorax dokdonensis]
MLRALQQLTLDLFGEAPPTQPAPDAARTNGAPTSPTKEQAPPSPSAVADLQAAPAMPLADAMAPARFTHPRASRQARLGHAFVDYEFTRVQRKSIGFVVAPEGLSVRAPRWIPLRDVDTALQEKADWIVRKLGEMRERQQRQESQRIEWRDGAVFHFLGEPITVVLDSAHGAGGAMLDAGADGSGRVLRLPLARHAGSAQVRDAAQAWLMRQARRIFIERLDHFAPLLGVAWKKVSLTNASTRWGSASADGTIRLHWRLVHLRMPVIDYVVAHELSHLRVMDHSPRFWETVESVMPDYALLRRQLKETTMPRWA